MSIEEKNAIETIKLFKYKYTLTNNDDKVIETVINLINKQQKEIEESKKLRYLFENEMLGYIEGYNNGKKGTTGMAYCVAHEFVDNILQEKITKLQEENNKLKEQNLMEKITLE